MMKNYSKVFKGFISILRNIFLITVITLLNLEIIVQFLWWNNNTITVLGRDVTLLPIPLVTQEQKEVLDSWSKGENNYWGFDSTLGWNIQSNRVANLEAVTYTSNSIGIRSTREYELEKPDNVTRLAAFGPSFTFGQEVSDKFAWPAQMENSYPNIEVMNWGVGAYGTDQAYLRYQTKGFMFKSDIVLIGIEEDSVFRNVNRYRPYYIKETGLPLTKPVFILQQNQLTLIANPFDEFTIFYDTLLNDPNEFIQTTCTGDFFCNNTYYYQIRIFDKFASLRFLKTLMYEMSSITQQKEQINPDEITIRLIEKFVNEVKQNRSVPIVIFFPQQPETLTNYENAIDANYHRALPILRDKMNVHIIDLAASFVDVKQKNRLQYEDFFVRQNGHYSELGNRIVAEAIMTYLCKHGLNNLNC